MTDNLHDAMPLCNCTRPKNCGMRNITTRKRVGALHSLKKCYEEGYQISMTSEHVFLQEERKLFSNISNGEHVQLVCCNSNLLSDGAAEF